MMVVAFVTFILGAAFGWILAGAVSTGRAIDRSGE